MSDDGAADSNISKSQQELWTIFTFYNLHAGCTDPGIMKRNRFVRFCQDVQIVRKVPLQQINLIYMSQVQTVPKEGASVTKRKAVTAKSLTFLDFLEILHKLAPQVYPKAASSTEAFRRVLLENVLPLAVTRPSVALDDLVADKGAAAFLSIDQDAGEDGDAVPGRAHSAHSAKVQNGLKGIFDFYASKCLLRRNGEVSSEVGRRRNQGGSTAQVATATRKEAKTLSNSQGKIGFKEAMDFAQDYCIFSSDSGSALLTTFEMANIYLSTVTMNPADVESVPHLTFSDFVLMFGRMAMKSYSTSRHCGAADESKAASPLEKLKALMLHMWQAVNHPRKTRAVMAENFRSGGELNAVGGKGGNVNINGSSLFKQAFSNIWEADGFANYVVIGSAVGVEGEAEETKKEEKAFKLKVGGSKATKKTAWEVDDLNIGGEADQEERDGAAESVGIMLKVSDLQKLFLRDRTLVDVVHGWIEDMNEAKARANFSRR